MIRTKIICTIGPSVNTLERIEALINAGMNVARLNFSHGTHEQHAEMIAILKQARANKGVPLAIMLDTKGPEIRLGKIKGDQFLLQKGQRWLLTGTPCEGDSEKVTIDPPEVLGDLKLGMSVLLDDGYIATKVIQIVDDGVIIEVENGGIIRSRKGVNVPSAVLSLPAVTEQDIADLRFGCEQDVDIVAASFVRSARHVLEVRHILEACGKGDTLLLAKIENREGVDNFDAIVQVVDGIMIARGDLGVEVPMSQVPSLQKMMIRKCYLSGKISVTATQMLESMIHNPRPTRAEASDVANAIYDGSSAVMLSGETAVGRYPIQTVEMMAEIAKEAEKAFDYRAFFAQHGGLIYHDVPSAVTLASVKTAYSLGAKSIFAFTAGGATARLISRLRPSLSLIAMTFNIKCYHQLALCWGARPILGPICNSVTEAFAYLTERAIQIGEVCHGDLVVVVAGSPFGVAGTTNAMIVESIGEVLVRGHCGFGERVYGNIAFVLDVETPEHTAAGKIVVITQCDERHHRIVQVSKGVVLQNHIDDLDSELQLMEMAKELNKPVLIRADEAVHILKDGQLVTLEPGKSLIYKGILVGQ